MGAGSRKFSRVELMPGCLGSEIIRKHALQIRLEMGNDDGSNVTATFDFTLCMKRMFG
jgi:hypothetical protein